MQLRVSARSLDVACHPACLFAREVRNCTLLAGDCSGQWELAPGTRLVVRSLSTMIWCLAAAKYAREEVRPERQATVALAAAVLAGVLQLFARGDLVRGRTCCRRGRGRCADALWQAGVDTGRCGYDCSASTLCSSAQSG